MFVCLFEYNRCVVWFDDMLLGFVLFEKFFLECVWSC